jgi:hypothetical protein
MRQFVLAHVHFGPSPLQELVVPTCIGWLYVTTIQTCLHFCYPCTALLGGIPGQVPSYRHLTHACHTGVVMPCWWVMLLQAHLLRGNYTLTVVEFQKDESFCG